MPRDVSTMMFACFVFFLAGLVQADTVITMPLPPQPAVVPPSAGISAVSASLVGHFKSTLPTGSQGTPLDLSQDGMDALERYSARKGRTRNHYMLTGYAPTGRFRSGARGQFYSSYQGPLGWGWGWWGNPIIVNNYCPGLQHPGCTGPVGGMGSFVRIGAF